MDKATCTITQKRFLRGRQTLTIDGDLIKSEYRQGLSLHEYRVDLRGLVPDPMRMKQVPVMKIVGLVFICVCGLGLSLIGIIGEAITQEHVVIGLAIVGVPVLILGVLAWVPTLKELIDVVFFQGPGGQVTLWPDLPGKEEFNEFLTVLTARIQDAQTREPTVLRQLRQAGIIDDWQYDQAVELFERKGDRPESW